MTNSAKIVLWIGLFMILAGIAKNWATFRNTIYGGAAAANPPNGVQHTPVPASGQCPTGYTKIGGQCVWVQPLGPTVAA